MAALFDAQVPAINKHTQDEFPRFTAGEFCIINHIIAFGYGIGPLAHCA
jgi:hypothetical protein